jgi:cytochrome c oxidase subunit IV
MADKTEHEHHGPSLGVYFTIFGALMVLTGVTVGVAFADLGPLGAPIAVAIAGVKATMVILYFMHVKYETRLIGLYALSGFVFVGILVIITVTEMEHRRPSAVDPLGPPAESAPPASAAP